MRRWLLRPHRPLPVFLPRSGLRLMCALILLSACAVSPPQPLRIGRHAWLGFSFADGEPSTHCGPEVFAQIVNALSASPDATC